MKEGQSLMFLGAATIDSPFDRLQLSFIRTVYSTALIFLNKGRNYAYHPYGFILSDLVRDDETSGEKPIRNAGRIVIELPSNLDVKIYFH